MNNGRDQEVFVPVSAVRKLATELRSPGAERFVLKGLRKIINDVNVQGGSAPSVNITSGISFDTLERVLGIQPNSDPDITQAERRSAILDTVRGLKNGTPIVKNYYPNITVAHGGSRDRIDLICEAINGKPWSLQEEPTKSGIARALRPLMKYDDLP